VSSAKADPPVFLIVAGPNGSGKSSAYQDASIADIGGSVWIINPDLLAARIRDVEGLEPVPANLESVRRIETWLEASIAAHQTVGVETVLSTPKYRRLVEKAKTLGFKIWLIYVLLDGPDRNVERVRLRVKKGGHAVPEDKIRERYTKSLNQMPWFLDRADRALLYDNSGAQPQLIGEKRDGIVILDDDALPAIMDVLSKVQTE